jgi:hypothetical protein
MLKPSLLFACCFGCAASTNDVLVTVAPEVISSLDGTAAVHVIVLADRDPVAKKPVAITADYTDRNGGAHAITEVDGITDAKGAFDATLTGLMWDGTGTVTVASGKVTGDATFAVLDRTPPKATISPPATARVGQDTTAMVHATDEIGVSQVIFETDSGITRGRSTIIASGASDATIAFDFAIPDTVTVGSTITLYALAADLSGNEGAAQPVTVTVTQ